MSSVLGLKKISGIDSKRNLFGVIPKIGARIAAHLFCRSHLLKRTKQRHYQLLLLFLELEFVYVQEFSFTSYSKTKFARIIFSRLCTIGVRVA